MIAIAVKPGGHAPELLDLPKPCITEDQVLVRGLAVGVCGTDRHIIHSGRPNTPPEEAYLILGHEGIGRVEAAGNRVEGLQPGTLVVPCVRRRSQERPYRADFEPFRDVTERGINGAHGFAQQWWIDPPQYLFPAPEELGVLAVLTETFTVSEKALNESIVIQTARLTEEGFRYRPPRVLITGLGPIGFAAAFISLARGFDVTIAGRRSLGDPQAQLAQDVGLSYLDTRETDFAELASPERSFDIILEASGNADLFLALLPALAERGIFSLIGSERKPEPTSVHLSMLLRQLMGRNQVIFGVVNAAAPRDFECAFEDMLWLEVHHPGALERMITHRFTVEEYAQAYAERPRDAIKQIVLL